MFRQFCVWLLACGLSLPGLAGAASLQVAPTSITVQARRTADGLKLDNTGTAGLHAQVRVFRWTQVDGEDVLEPTNDIAISPPMIELPPGAQQLVRVVRLGPPPEKIEASYRVIVDELPVDELPVVAGPADQTADNAHGLQFMLRYSVPVFLSPREGLAAFDLQTRVVRTDAGTWLEIGNQGNGHAQIADLVFVDARGRHTALAPGLAGYVLPGQRKRWHLPTGYGTSVFGTFEARINGESQARALVRTAPGD